MRDREPGPALPRPEDLEWRERGHGQYSELRVAQLRRLAGAGGLGAAALGLAVIVGWALDVPRLTQVAPGLVTMKLNTAASLAVLGGCVWLLSRVRPGRRARVAVTLMSAAVVLMGTATLVEYAFSLDLGFDNPFGLDRAGVVGTSRPGRMSPMSAACLAGLGGALLALQRERVRAGQWMAWGTFVVSTVAVPGYLFGLERLYRIDIYTSMAVHTAVALATLSLAVLCLRAGDGFMLLATGDTAGGIVVRRLLPWVVVLPTATGGLLVAGLERDWYDVRFALAVFVTLMTVAGAAGTWVLGRRLRSVDLRRADAEDVLAQLQASLAERDRLAARLTSSEQHAREVVENSADAYIALSPAGRVEDWNQAATQLFGWSRAEATGRQLDGLIIPPELARAHRAGLARASNDGRGPLLGKPVEVEAVHRRGHRLVIELTIWSVEVREGWEFHAFLRDVTDRRTAEIELRRMNDDLSQFAGVVAHDLRTPLTTIAGYSELLRERAEETATDAQTSDWIGRVEAAAQRGQHLIADLLALTQVGQAELHTEPVPLDVLLAEVVEEQRSQGGDQARVEVAPLPVVEGDAGLLRQLFANLVGNAFKYGGTDGPPIVCIDALPGGDGDSGNPDGGETPTTGATPGHVVVRVSDNGPGIAPDERVRVFEMFQRGRDVGSISGTGVGLAISRLVAERHHGRIWVGDSDLGGSAFYVELPAAPVPR